MSGRGELVHAVRLEARRDRAAWFAVCSCGWAGPWQGYGEALEAATEHRDYATG